MRKNVLVISTSSRVNGNSDTLANEFLKGAHEQGNVVKKIHLYNKQILFCKGCLVCQKNGMCILHDDMAELLEEMRIADVIAFATPIYFYEMSGQMKTFLDRTNPLFETDHKVRDIYLLASAADEEKDAFDGAVHGLQGWIRCFDKTTLRGVVKGFHLQEAGDVYTDKKVLKEAYEAGASIA